MENTVSRRVSASAMRLLERLRGACAADVGEEGMTTAELLGNAALGVFALIVIWAGLREVGLDVVQWIRSDLAGAR